MDWHEFRKIPQRTLYRARSVVTGVVGNADKFYAERLQGDSGFREVVAFLEGQRTRQGQPYTHDTIRAYLCAVSRLLGEAQKDNACYRAKINEHVVKPAPTTADFETAKAVLDRLMSGSNRDIAILAGSIFYRTKIQVQHLLEMRCDEDNGKDNYLDLVHGKAYIRDGEKVLTYTVPREFCDFVQKRHISMWLLGSRRLSAQSVSTSFKRAAKMPYREVRTMYLTDTEEETNDTTTKVKVTVRPKGSTEKVKVSVRPKGSTEKVKVSVNVRQSLSNVGTTDNVGTVEDPTKIKVSAKLRQPKTEKIDPKIKVAIRSKQSTNKVTIKVKTKKTLCVPHSVEFVEEVE